MKIRGYLTIIAVTGVCAAARAQRPQPPVMGLTPSDMAMVTNNPAQVLKEGSYALGINYVRGFKAQGIQIDGSELTKGILDEMGGKAADGSTNTLPETEVRTRLRRLQELMKVEADKKAEENKIKGMAWLEENKKKPGVVVLPDGLQYKVIKEGTGEQPHSTNVVFVNYRGKLTDGTEFDESYSSGKPSRMDMRGVVKGFSETLELTKVGGQVEAYIPSDLAYGPRGRRGKVSIPPNAVLIFNMELVSVTNAPPPVALKAPAAGNMVPPPGARAPQPGGAVQTSQVLQVNPDGTSKLLPPGVGTGTTPPPAPPVPPAPKP